MQRLMVLIAALLLTLSLATGSAVMAQEQPPQPDYDAWMKQADQAEELLETGKADDDALQGLRERAVQWRETFHAAQGTNSTRIATLKDQIAALGPLPAEGQTESEDVAARRKDLNTQLSELQAPGLKAVEAYGRADGIIQQIDQTIRLRQANALIRRTPTPLNPAHWGTALKEGADLAGKVYAEVKENWKSLGSGQDRIERLLVTSAFLIAALLLLSRGRHWVDSLPSRLSARASDRSRAALIFAVSLGQIAIPFLGVLLGIAALVATELFRDWGRPLLMAIPAASMTFFGGFWLVRRIFPEPGTSTSQPLPMTEDLRRMAAFRATMLTFALAIHQVVARPVLPLSGFPSQNPTETVPEQLSEASAGVWHLLIILLGAFFLYQLCNVLRRLKPEGGNTPDYRTRIVVYLGMAGRLVALAAPLLAMAGYVTAGNAFLWATTMTLALVGLLIVLQDFIADLYAMAKGGDQSARDALMPVLISFALVVLSLPLFVLIWGGRGSDLGEAWKSIEEGFSFGGVRLSPVAILTFLIVFGAGYSLTRFIQGAFRSSILPKTRLDAGGQNAVASMLGYVGVALATVLAISSAGIDLSSLAIVAGALSVGIGFGMQQVVSNFVSGIILLVERPIAVGDWIEVGGKQGTVKKMSVRATQIQTFDRNNVIVPNSDLITQQVTNWTRGSLQGRIIVPVGVAYGSDTRKVAKILMEIAEDQPTVLINPPPAVLFRGFAADSMTFEIRAVLSDINGGAGVTSEINHEIAQRFAQEGIEIPYAQRDIWLRNPEVLALLAAGAANAAAETGATPQKPEAPPAAATPKAPPLHRDEAPVYDDDADGDGDADGDNDGDSRG
ncbi:MAG TPA: DUF3772 domain-containing protein [Paracoccus sp. (in: a-proteobacteria)]|uniref:DUF3772 domain-containing protein n=1 Tax=Paracoccus sp. TaxID=267 RepID=UPI002BCE36D0|nr:DUF3772 domain-containing protein [Paracoccus sp. (in: a-proteobacteria)]HWL56912.1 DUF3772 domain-containing protein [Paracoccus sp. (in: a-proteobacteria)]